MAPGGAQALARHAPLGLLAALALGLLVGPYGAPVVPLAALAVAATCMAGLAARGGSSTYVVILLALAGWGAGAAWGAARVQHTQVQVVTRTGAVQGTVVVDQPPQVTSKAIRAQVVVDHLTGAAARPGTRLLLDLPVGAQIPKVGYVLRVKGRMALAARPGAPDWWFAWLRRQHIAGRIYAAGWDQVAKRGGVVGTRDAMRRWAGDNVAQGLTGDLKAVVRGMALGGGAGMTDGTAQEMRDAGVWHLLAVSGQNVAVVAIGMAAVLGAAGVSRRGRLIGMGVAIVIYCLTVDGGASVARAGLVGGLAVIADLGGSPRRRWYALLLALVVLLAWDPLSADDPGLQLSFAAVCGLFVISPPLAQWLRGYVPARMADLIAQSGGAGLATAPVLASGFGSISTVGLLANLVAVPVAGPVVVVALLGTLGHWLWAPIGVLLSYVAAIGAGLVIVVARMASSVPGAVVPMSGWGALPLAVLAAAPAVVWWWLRRAPGDPVPGARRGAPSAIARVALVASLGALAVAVVGVPGCGSSTRTPAGPGVRVLDVGQGSATVLRDGTDGSVLVDTGPPGTPAPVLDALSRAGITQVAAIVISHGAMDHAGGTAAVMDAVTVGRVVLPDPDRDAPLVRQIAADAAARGIPVTWASAGSDIASGPWDARVVGPGPDAARSAEPNDRSLVLLARAPGLTVLLPGDAEGNVLRNLSLPPTSVLVVPHHGSEDLAIAPVLKRLRPTIAVISSGRGNQFGHPRAQVLAALGAEGARVLRTDQGGDVDLRAGMGGIVVVRG